MTSTAYRVDALHLGIRLMVPIVMLLGVALGVWVIMPALFKVLPISGVLHTCLYGIGVLAIAVGLAGLTEYVLRRVWPSGRMVEVDDSQIVLRERSGEGIAIQWDKHINLLTWYFVVRQRRAWVQKGWFCAACRLNQDEKLIVVYSFLKPAVAQGLPQWPRFEELISQKQVPRRGEETQLRKLGEQAQLRAAERERWEDGAEMASDDFVALMGALDKHVTPQSGEQA